MPTFFVVIRAKAAYSPPRSIRISVISIIEKFKVRTFDLISFVVDLLGFSWMPSGIRLLKGSCIVVFFVYLFSIFSLSKRKKLLISMVLAAILFCWPSILLRHQDRYLYIALPFFISFMIISIGDLLRERSNWKKALGRIGVFLISSLSVLGVRHNYDFMKSREYKFFHSDEALRHLVKNPKLSARPICFVGVPRAWFPSEGIAQAVWIYRGNNNVPVYYDNQMAVYHFRSLACKETSNLSRDKLVDVSMKEGILNIKSLDHERAWFWANDSTSFEWQLSIGTLKRKSIGTNRSYDFDVKIDSKWLENNTAFVTWDYENQKFNIL